ncbi:MAG: PorT family protein [Prevotella sp.]|nr:PorT family protein [Prevotella sp.]
MKRLIVSAIIMVIVSFNAIAQKEPGTTTIYPRIGLNLSKMSEDVIYTTANNWSDYTIKPKFKLGLTVGAEVQHQFSTFTGASIGLLYSQQGTGYSDHESEGTTEYWRITDWKTTLHYLNMPILLVENIGYSGFSVKAGIQPGLLLDARSKNSEEYGNIVDGYRVRDDASSSTEGDVKDAFRHFDLSVPIGIAYERNNFAIDLRYNIGLLKQYKYFDEHVRNQSIVLTFGYGLDL